MASELNVGKVAIGAQTFTAHTAADDLVIKTAVADTGITIRSDTEAGTGSIFFAERSNTAVGQIRYNHNTDNMAITAADEINFTCDLATFSAGIVTSEKGVLSGSVTVADDAVTTITPQRKGGFIHISTDTTAGDGGYPVKSDSSQIWFDCGSSLNIEKLDIGTVGSQVETQTGNLTGTVGTDDRVTVSVQAGVIQIENRRGGTRIFNYTIIS